MGTSFDAIYSRAITELKDPDIKRLLNDMPILFSQVMHNFLVNAVPLFDTPLQVRKRLSGKTAPYEIVGSIKGDGISDTFKINDNINVAHGDNIIGICYINNNPVDCYINAESNTIKLAVAPSNEDVVNYQIYYVGSFDIDLYDEEVYILSQLLLSCWTEYITNDKLDNIRLLGDTDFKLPANATTLLSKLDWNIVNREVATKRMKKYAWDARMLGLYK